MHIQEDAFNKINEAFRNLPSLPSQARNLPKYAVWSDLPPGTPNEPADPTLSGKKSRIKNLGIKIAVCFLVVSCLVAVVFFRVITSQRALAAEALASHIEDEEVRLDDLEAKPSSKAGTYRVTGRLHNFSSKNTIGSISLRLQMSDRTNTDADVVGEKRINMQIIVPPGQVRGISEDITFTNLPERRGEYEWSCVITRIRSQKAL